MLPPGPSLYSTHANDAACVETMFAEYPLGISWQSDQATPAREVPVPPRQRLQRQGLPVRSTPREQGLRQPRQYHAQPALHLRGRQFIGPRRP